MAKSSHKKAEPHKYTPSKGPTKVYFKDGHWVEKRTHAPILVCSCGMRYLKTRPGQVTCLQCIHRPPQNHKKGGRA